MQEKIDLLKEIFGGSRQTGNEYLFFCPACNHHKKKLSINLEKDAWKCWICDRSGRKISRLIRKYGDYLQRQKWASLNNDIDLSNSFENLFEKKQSEFEQKIDLPKEFISLCNKKLPVSAIAANQYLQNRNIDKTDILKWKIGYCPIGEYKNRVVIPSFNLEGNINYFEARTYIDDWIKYKKPACGKDVVFNELYIDWKNDLTIVEGVFDAIVAGNAIPILGSTLREDSNIFQKIIKYDTPIYIALDSDAEKKAMKLIKQLLLYDVEVYKIDIEDGDVGQLTKEQFKKRKAIAKSMTSDNHILKAWESV
jgi:DNA primase